MTWHGTTPIFLLILLKDETNFTIDVDEPGWVAKHKDLMREPGKWYLVRKENGAIIGGVVVDPGEKPYYLARHIGIGTARPDSNGRVPATETIAYGIGKHRLDGHNDRLWFFMNGFVCAGDDVERFALDMIKSGVAP